MSKAKWAKSTTDNLCPFCNKPGKCLVAPDRGAAICWKADSKVRFVGGNRMPSMPVATQTTPVRQPNKRSQTYATLKDAEIALRIAVRRATAGGCWIYKGADDEPLMAVIRLNLSDGKKTCRPLKPVPDGKWSLGDPDGPLPLYNLPSLQAAGRVYIVEGEKCVDALRSVGLTAVTSSHGAAAAEKSDWSPLAGREVAILPDADEAGSRYAAAVATRLMGLTPPAHVCIIDTLPGPDGGVVNRPEGWDVADYFELRDSDEPDVLASTINGLVGATPAWVPPAGEGVTTTIEPLAIGLDTIMPRSVDWLWTNRLQVGAINLIVGQPGAGKTFVTCDLIARITHGRDWPDGEACQAGSVIIANAEDDPESVLRPRCDAAGADASKVKLLHEVLVHSADGKKNIRPFKLADVDALRILLNQLQDCRAVIIDPIGSFLGSRVDTHRDNEVREVLTPLAALAREYRIAIICVVHTRKATGGGADERALGSRAFTGVARCVQHLVNHPDCHGTRCLLPGKANNAPSIDGLSFRIEGTPATVAWDNAPMVLTADDAYSGRESGGNDDRRPGPAPEKYNAAASFLAEVLKDCAVPVAQVKAQAKEALISEATLRRAAVDLEVISEKSGYTQGWTWRFKKDGGGRPVVPVLPNPDWADESPAMPTTTPATSDVSLPTENMLAFDAVTDEPEQLGDLSCFDVNGVKKPIRAHLAEEGVQDVHVLGLFAR